MARTSEKQKAADLILGSQTTESAVERCIEVIRQSPLDKTQQRSVLRKLTQVGAASLELSRIDAEIKTAQAKLKATKEYASLKQFQLRRKQLQAAQSGMNQQIIGIMEALKTPALENSNGEAL